MALGGWIEVWELSKDRVLKKAEVLAGEQTSIPWAQPFLVGVVTRWLSNNTWSAILQWVSNLFTCRLLNLRNKKSSWHLEITALVFNVSFEFHWINEINWAARPGGELLVSRCRRKPTSGRSADLQWLCLEFKWWPSLPASQTTAGCNGGSLEKVFANEALAALIALLDNQKLMDDGVLCLEISFKVCIYVLTILTHSSHLYDLLVFSPRGGMLPWLNSSVANYILSTYISVKFHLDFVTVVDLNSMHLYLETYKITAQDKKS